MVINYSKWDALELSDDSDIEVHPNVDKRSFIRAKQNQIHQEREHRRHQIKTLKYERIINDGFIERIDRLLTALKSHKDKAASADSGSNTDQLVFQSMMESVMASGEERPPPPPEGVHEQIKDKPTYPQMLAGLIDEVKKEVDAKEGEGAGNRIELFIQVIDSHKARVEDLQRQLLTKLAELEKEEKKHITSDDIHDGFNYSNVKQPSQTSASSSTPAAAAKKSETTIELLNSPTSRPPTSRTDTGQSSGADADIEEGTAVDDDSVEASPLAQQFAKIKRGDWPSCFSFLNEHPSLLSEKETDGLLVEAFNSELEGKPKHAKQCVHAGLLLQYCRQLGGRDGVALFFKRVQSKDHQAYKMFHDDVDSTYGRIRTRAAEIKKEREENAAAGGSEGVEQIQLHAVDPNTTITISVPPEIPTSTDPEEREAEKQAREIYDAFPPGLQRALTSGSLDEVNKVLAKMSVDEAEEVVEKLGAGGMLSLEQGVVDATTDEGRRVMEEIERTGRMPGQQDQVTHVDEVD